MNFPEDLKYSKEHTWLRISDNIGTIGITEFAQSVRYPAGAPPQQYAPFSNDSRARG